MNQLNVKRRRFLAGMLREFPEDFVAVLQALCRRYHRHRRDCPSDCPLTAFCNMDV